MTTLARPRDHSTAEAPGHPGRWSGPVGYVLKMYPRFSETFIVNEILAHEAAGLDIEIFSLRPPTDGRFHDMLSRVRAPVTYVPSSDIPATEFWQLLYEAGAALPSLWEVLPKAAALDVRDVVQAVCIARAARERGIVHLHAHFATVAAEVARLAARLAGITYSITAHAKDIFHDSVDPDRLRIVLRDAAAVVTVSQFNLAFLRETFGADAMRVSCVYNGLDLERFAFTARQARPPQIVSVGRLIEKKGFEDLIDACALLAGRGLRFGCTIIGTGPLEATLGARIAGHGLGDRITLTGARPQHEVIEAVGAAAVFAAPCVVGSDGNRDGLPTVLLEAMALGTPVVATPVTGIPEVVLHGETGLLHREHDPVALAAAIERVLADSVLQRRLARAARSLIEERFDIQKNTAAQRNLFVGAVTGAPS